MQEQTHNQTLEQLLDRLVQVLADERSALIRMDAQAVENAAGEKSLLNDQIREHGAFLSPAQRLKLHSIQGQLQQNLILLAHARDFLHNALGITSTSQRPLGRPSSPHVAPARLDLRG